MCRPREASPPLPAALALLRLKLNSSLCLPVTAPQMGSRRAPHLQPVGAHLQPVGGDGAPVADMLVDELSMAGANLLLPKAADAVASLTMTTIATMPDAMPLAMAQPVAQEVGVSTRKRRPAISKARSGLASRKRNREALGFDEQLKQDVARLAKLARWSKRREDAPAPTAMAMTARANALSRAFAKGGRIRPPPWTTTYYKAKARRQRQQQ